MPYQVLNQDYSPYGKDDDDMAVFYTYGAAIGWIDELHNMGVEEDFFIRTVTIRQNKYSKLRTIPYINPYIKLKHGQ